MTKMSGKRRFEPEDEDLLRTAEELLSSDSPALALQRELILEVFRTLLDMRWAKERLKVVLTPAQTTTLEGRLHDCIATIICQTYAELGDVAPLADDEALMMIREELLYHDPEILDRNRFRRLRTGASRSRRSPMR
jgi:hypothetical protein